MDSPKSADYQLRPDRDLTVLIPARAGSKRCPGKNTRLLGGKPLIQWTIDAAKAANVAKIIVSTDDAVALSIAADTGCVIHRRKPQHATDDAPDFLWVNDLIGMVSTPYFAICRPTSPFRTASMIRRGFAALVASDASSIRALSRLDAPHPCKMWAWQGKTIIPVMYGWHPDGTPFHSSPTQSLPAVYIQNASLEIVRTWVVEATRTISGTLITGLMTDADESVEMVYWREPLIVVPESVPRH